LYDNMIICGIVDFIVNKHVQSNCKVSIINLFYLQRIKPRGSFIETMGSLLST